MDNRRSSFLCAIPLAERLEVELLMAGSAASLQGTIVDLSISGMAVSLADPTKVGQLGQRCQARFVIPPGTRFTLPAVLVHAAEPNEPHLGFQFLSHPDPALLAAREKTLWNYLLEAQRRRRRERLAAAG